MEAISDPLNSSFLNFTSPVAQERNRNNERHKQYTLVINSPFD